MSYLERDLSLAVGGHQLGVHALRSATRRQPQDEVAKGDEVGVKKRLVMSLPILPSVFYLLGRTRFVLVDPLDDVLGGPVAHPIVVCHDNEPHFES